MVDCEGREQQNIEATGKRVPANAYEFHLLQITLYLVSEYLYNGLQQVENIMETTRGVYNAFQLKLWEVRKELRVLGFNFGIEFSASNAAKGRLPVTPEEFERLGLSDDQQGCALLLQSEEAAWCYRTKMQHLLDAGQVIAITRLLQLQVVSITRHYDSMP